GAEERQALARMVDAALNRMLHDPTVFLRDQAATRGVDAEESARVLVAAFRLDEPTPTGASSPSLSPPAEVAAERGDEELE
ncbi:MAG TPA: hypothetical protein VLC09_20765, partial [Polyangiaceae bacterium]|nr:hypothetical protein [Polyangiaceae bacterium]